MPEPLELLLFLAASAAVPGAVAVIFLYLRAAFGLLETVKEDEPEFWRHLGSPQRQWVRSQQGGFHTIRPLGPFLSWVWSGDASLRPPRVAAGLLRTRLLLRLGLACFVAAVGAVLTLVIVAS